MRLIVKNLLNGEIRYEENGLSHRCCYGVFHVFFQCLCRNLTEPGTSDLTLNASKGVAYTLSIPSGTKDIQIVADAQEIGEIGLTAANFTQGSIDVKVTSGNDFNLKNGEVSVGYTLNAAENKYTFTEVAALTKVNLTITDTNAATIAGTYTDTLTFTATENNVK